MKDQSSPGNTFLAFVPGLVVLAFVGMKITGTIDWSWAWVLAPLWVPLALISTLIIVAALLRELVIINQTGRRNRTAMRNRRKLGRHEAGIRR